MAAWGRMMALSARSATDRQNFARSQRLALNEILDQRDTLPIQWFGQGGKVSHRKGRMPR